MNTALWAWQPDGNGGTATFPTCVFFDSSGVQQDSPTGAESMTLLATTTKASLTDIVLAAARVIDPSYTLAQLEAWKADNGIVGMRSGEITGNPCDMYMGAEQVTSPVFNLAVGQRAYLGQLPIEAYPFPPGTYPPNAQVYSFIPDATDELLIATGPRVVWGVFLFTIDATPVFVKLYDKATAPSEADTPKIRLGLLSNSTAANGAASNGAFPVPIPFSLGLGVRAVTGLADNSDAALTAAENFVNVIWS